MERTPASVVPARDGARRVTPPPARDERNGEWPNMRSLPGLGQEKGVRKIFRDMQEGKKQVSGRNSTAGAASGGVLGESLRAPGNRYARLTTHMTPEQAEKPRQCHSSPPLCDIGLQPTKTRDANPCQNFFNEAAKVSAAFETLQPPWRASQTHDGLSTCG